MVTREQAIIHLETVIRPKREGTPSCNPARYCRKHGIPFPEWVKECRRLRLREYMSTHPQKRLEINKLNKERHKLNPEKRAEYSRDYYGSNKDICFARTYSYLFLKRNNLLTEGWEIHHCFGADGRSFVYMPREVHKMLHRRFGYKNEDVGIAEFYQAIDLIPEYMVFVDFKLVDASDNGI